MLGTVITVLVLAGIVWLIVPRKREPRAKPSDDGRSSVDLHGHGWWKERR